MTNCYRDKERKCDQSCEAYMEVPACVDEEKVSFHCKELFVKGKAAYIEGLKVKALTDFLNHLKKGKGKLELHIDRISKK